MGSLRIENQKYIVEEFLKRYKVETGSSLDPLLAFVEYAFEKMSTDHQLLYNDKIYVSLESEAYRKLCEVFRDCDQIIEALQFLEDQAYYLSKQASRQYN